MGVILPNMEVFAAPRDLLLAFYGNNLRPGSGIIGGWLQLWLIFLQHRDLECGLTLTATHNSGKMKVAVALLALVAMVNADMYLHNPR